MDVNGIYHKLLTDFGPQYWWPGETTLEIIVGAVLTQSVAWTNVEKAINRLKAVEALNELYILNVPEETLGELIRSTLYFTQKSRKLKVLFSWLEQECQFDYNKLFSHPLIELREDMLGLWGMGKETVDSILCYAGNLPVMVVDAYTRRIFFRLGLAGEKASYDELQQILVSGLPTEAAVYNEMHALLVKLGKDYCRNQKPRCQQCPLKNDCQWGQHGRNQ